MQDLKTLIFRKHQFASLFMVLFMLGSIHAQTVIYEKTLNESNIFQVIKHRVRTNRTEFKSPDTLTDISYSAFAYFNIIDQHGKTNCVWKASFVDRDVLRPTLYVRDEGNLFMYTLTVCDVLYVPSKKRVAVLYLVDSRYICCRVSECPPFPGKPLCLVDHSFYSQPQPCCELQVRFKDRDSPVNALLVQSAHLEYDGDLDMFRVVLQNKPQVSVCRRVFERREGTWILMPPSE